MKHLLSIITGLAVLSAPAMAQTAAPSGDVAIVAPSQQYCVTVMSGFPNDDHVARYQFFRLTQDIAEGATPQFRAALSQYGDADVNEQTPILDVIEAIANPVLRQAAPEMVIGFMEHLIDFEDRCGVYLDGQISSLKAYDGDLIWEDPLIAEDALFLRQILSESLERAGASNDPSHAFASQDYAANLISTRDNMEFQVFTTEIDDLEALYMTDLDGRLARSNDIINKEMDRESLDDAVTLANDMDKDFKEKEDQRRLYTLWRILGR